MISLDAFFEHAEGDQISCGQTGPLGKSISKMRNREWFMDVLKLVEIVFAAGFVGFW